MKAAGLRDAIGGARGRMRERFRRGDDADGESRS
jgi:hypothetical protein